ncbi:MAG: SIR2 family protein [Ignavibacteriaceae bacterium]
MEIPKHLVDQIRLGQVVLLLGSGASFGALHPKGGKPPLGNELAKLICNKFLGNEYCHLSLAQVSELAISESNLFEVQSFVAEILKDFDPADFHCLIPCFKWAGIFTTNYDLIIEKAYQKVSNRVQNLITFKKDHDRVQDKIKNENDLCYIKLHGCISEICNPDLPLILTSDQYITHKKNRQHLFNRLEEYAYNYPFVFIGHSLTDMDLRIIMLELDKLLDVKPRSYLISPNLTEAEKRFWAIKKIHHMPLSFSEFLKELDSKIPIEIRKLSVLIKEEQHPIFKKYGAVSDLKMSESLKTFLTRDVEYIHSSIKTSTIDAKTFYKGYFNSFSPIISELDVKRKINDKILSEVFLVNEEMKRENAEFYVLLGYAGSGKTISLKRIAWDAAINFDKLCLFANSNTFINYESILELHGLTKERIYLFVDPVSDYNESLKDIIINARRDKLPITIVGCARKNEWNTNCDELKPFITDTYELTYLNDYEIEKLIGLLSKYNSLGHLKGLSLEKQKYELSYRAGRQLLVALYEATLGEPFTNIIFDEYKSISSIKAQSLYLTICILHRLGIQVRAGLISRAHGISFNEFQERLFKPLEYIVFTLQDKSTKDYYYQTRHSNIAEIVFERVLVTPQDRFDEYVRILKSLDLGYNSDNESFKGLMNAKKLISLFPDPTMVRQLFELAESIKPNDPMLLQQEAIFEMNCKSGNIVKAEVLFEKAYKLAPHNKALAHSLSVLGYEKSQRAKNILERTKYREDSKKIALSLISTADPTSHAYHTLVSISIDELEETISEGDPGSIERKVKEVEKLISSALQKFPDESFLLDSESRYALLLNKNPKAKESIFKAFEMNKRSTYLASRLSDFYEKDGEGTKAISVLKDCVDANPSDKNANFKLALLLMKYDNNNLPEIKFHLKRSFTEGDANYMAQFWYAQIIYSMNEFDNAIKVFKSLGNLNLDSRVKREIRTYIKENSEKKLFTGIIVHLENSYCFICRDGFQDSIFSYHNLSDKNEWEKLRTNDRVSCIVGFNYYGPIAVDLKKI